MTLSLRLDAAIEVCTRHLDGVENADPEIEAVLAGHVAAVAYAAFEARVRELIAERCRHPHDEPINRFAGIAAQRLVRSIKVTELSGFLGFFGDAEKRAFQAAMAEDPQVGAAWDSLLTGRHGIAHENNTPSLTFADVIAYVADSERVLTAFETALAQS